MTFTARRCQSAFGASHSILLTTHSLTDRLLTTRLLMENSMPSEV